MKKVSMRRSLRGAMMIPFFLTIFRRLSHPSLVDARSVKADVT
jgi:hypothetical protein